MSAIIEVQIQCDTCNTLAPREQMAGRSRAKLRKLGWFTAVQTPEGVRDYCANCRPLRPRKQRVIARKCHERGHEPPSSGSCLKCKRHRNHVAWLKELEERKNPKYFCVMCGAQVDTETREHRCSPR